MNDDFIKKTNEEYVAWCKSYYNPEALDKRGMISLHGLWAWQEQEQRMGELRQQLAEQAKANDLQLHTNRRMLELEPELLDEARVLLERFSEYIKFGTTQERVLYAKIQTFLGDQGLDGPVPGLKSADDCGIRYVE